MEHGRVVFEGPASTLRGNDEIREFYLGLGGGSRRRSFGELNFYKRRTRWAF